MESLQSERLIGFTSQKVRLMSTEIQEELTTEYNYFFGMIVDSVIGATTTPGVLTQYTAWKSLSKKWVKQKGTNRHYIGLSVASTSGKALGRRGTNGNGIGLSRLRANGTKPKGLQKVGALAAYMRSLNVAGSTARFFGPITSSYDFVPADPKIRVVINQADGVVKRVTVLSTVANDKGLKSFMAFPKTMKMTVNIAAFGKLKGVSFNEKSVVDYIIKRIDPANEKQWVKINSEYGIGRSKRPIRAVITPILKYYMAQRFPEIVKAAIKSRGG